MTRRSRRILLLALTLVFLTLGTGTVLYADGWRLDLTTFQISKVGAILIHYAPADATLHIDGEVVRKRFAIFQSGAFVSGLFPGQHHIAIERDGYLSWERGVSVEPSQVTEIKYATLIPTRPRAMASSTGAASFDLVGIEPLLHDASGSLRWQGRTLPAAAVIGWTRDENRLLVRRGADYKWYDLTTASATDVSALTRAARAPLDLRQHARFLVDPTDSSRLIAYTTSTLALLEIERSNLPIIATSTGVIRSIAASRNYIAWTVAASSTEASQIQFWNKSTQTITTASAPVDGAVTEADWSPDGALALLTDAGTLYLYDPAADRLESRANTVRSFAFSADGTMLATVEQHSMEIFSRTTNDYWRFNLPDAETAVRATWHRDGHHVFVHYPDRVLFLDLEDRGLETFQVAAQTTHAEYEPLTNMLYYLEPDTGRVVALQFPTER